MATILETHTATTTNPAADSARQWLTQAGLGGLVWLIWAVAVRPEWTAVLLMLSPFVLLPLGLRLAAGPETGPTAPSLRRLEGWAPFVALTAAASFLPEAGLVATLLSIPWLAFTAGVAVIGSGRVLSRQKLLAPGIAADAGLIFLIVGGAWLTISRAGANPLGFSDAIVQLTAVHFHYAGFALPIVAGFTASRLGRSTLIPLAVIVGVPLTAIGITAGGWLEWVAATAMALAGMATAALLVMVAAKEKGGARVLSAIAGAALFAGMGLALGWAWSIRFGWSYLGLEGMAAYHGSLNALGFGLLGLIGLNLITQTTGEEEETPAMNMHLGRPTPATMHTLLERAERLDTTNVPGLLDRPTPAGFERKVWRREVGHGNFDAAAEAIRQWHGHEAAGISRLPTRPPIAVGETLAVAIPVGPISVSATSRIVDVVDEPDRFGFTYSTMPHHVVDGEESFIVSRHPDGTVDIVVTAVWRSATLANAVCPPITRFLQNRAINQYLDGIAAPW